MSWFKTYRGRQLSTDDTFVPGLRVGKHRFNSNPDDAFYFNRNETLHRDKAMMGYEDIIRPARKHHVESAPVFVQSANDTIFLTDYTQAIRLYQTNGKRLESVHAESKKSILSGLAVDKNCKSLYVCDAQAHGKARIQIFNLGDHDITPIVYLGHGLFKAPHGIAVTPDYRTLVTDVERKEIFIIQDDGVSALCFGGEGRKYGQFAFPHDVAYDKQYRRIVVSDTHNHRIQVFDDDGKFLNCIEFDDKGHRHFSFPTGLTFDNRGNLIVCENGANRLHVLDPNFRSISAFPFDSLKLKRPTAVTVLKFERLCVASREDECFIIF